jgi:hypothetical protein
VCSAVHPEQLLDYRAPDPRVHFDGACSLIAVGDPLGKRFTVSRAPDEERTGELFEVIDRDAAAVAAQLLGATPSPADHLADLRPVLGAVPSNSTLLRPREITMNRASLPIAIFGVPGLVPVRSRLGEVTGALGKPGAVAALFVWFAAIATDLDRVHGAGICHGAINQRYFACLGGGPVERCSLVGFGIDALARRANPDLAPATPRRDLVDLLGALHDLFITASITPEGGAAGKWTLLRHSSQHGEHPALASGAELGKTLTELAKLCQEPDAPLATARPMRQATLAPPTRADGGRNPTIPPPRSTTRPRENTGAGPGPDRSSRAPRAAATAPPAPARPPRRWLRGVLVGVGLAVLAVGGGLAYLSTLSEEPISLGMLRTGRRRGPAAPRCEGETLDPPAGYETASSDFDVACAPDGRTLVAVARGGAGGTAILTASREARRGQAWSHLDASDATGAVELGAAVATGGGLWSIWRNGVGEPIGLAEISRVPHAHARVPLTGWDNVPLQRVMLLHRDAASTWVVGNVESEGGAHPVLFHIQSGEDRGRAAIQTWYLGAGTVEAVVPGPAPALLVRQRADDGSDPAARSFRLSALWPQLTALAAARPGGDPTSVRGATPSDNALRRSATVTLPGEVLASRSTGAGLGDEAGFAVTAHPAAQCPNRAECVGPGAVHLLRFSPARPAPIDVAVGADSVALDVISEAPDRWLVLHEPAGVAAHPALRLTTVAGAAPAHATLANPGADRGRLVRCGGSVWLAQQIARPTPRIIAVPSECLTAR